MLKTENLIRANRGGKGAETEVKMEIEIKTV